MWYYHIVEFIESQLFTRRLHELGGERADEVLIRIQRDLEAKPERGALVPGLAGVRKARVANPAGRKGTRGGFRYLYMFLERRQHVHLLFLLDKTEQGDATQEQRKQMRRWAEQLKKAGGD